MIVGFNFYYHRMVVWKRAMLFLMSMLLRRYWTQGIVPLFKLTMIWSNRVVTENFKRKNRRNNKDQMQYEFSQFGMVLSTTSVRESRTFRSEALKNKQFTRNGRIANLFVSVPESAVQQESHFSEFKLRSAGIKSWVKVETLDRDSIAHPWLQSSK